MTDTVKMVSSRSADRGRRQRILDVALRHFERFGFRKTSIDDITREVGIAKGSFYLEFDSKDALLMAVVAQLRDQATEYYTSRMAEASTPTERVRTLLQLQFELYRQQPLYRRLVHDDPEFHIFQRILNLPGMHEAAEAMLRDMQALLREGIEAGEFRPDLDLTVTPFAIGALKLLHFEVDIATAGLISHEQFAQGLVDMAVNSLLKHCEEPQ